jgi:hypothetical protein
VSFSTSSAFSISTSSDDVSSDRISGAMLRIHGPGFSDNSDIDNVSSDPRPEPEPEPDALGSGAVAVA